MRGRGAVEIKSGRVCMEIDCRRGEGRVEVEKVDLWRLRAVVVEGEGGAVEEMGGIGTKRRMIKQSSRRMIG